MIVAFDLRYAADHWAGIGKHAYALLEALLEQPGDERYAVLWDPRERNTRHDLDVIRRHPRVDWFERPYHFINPLGAVQVGMWLRGLRPSVYLSPFSLRPIASGCPDVLTIHDVAALRVAHASSRITLVIFRGSLLHASRASAIVTDSEFSRREILATLPVSPERVHAIPLGVPVATARAAPARRPASLPPGRFALVVGDNRPRKNLATVARAWAGLGDATDLALIGAGPVDARFPSLGDVATEHGARRVQHLGWLLPEELAWLYANAELLLLPSVYEGFGFPLVEAFAAGLPALVSDIPVFREVGAGAAAYADPADPLAWTREVLRIAADPGLRARMREAGRLRAGELTYHRTAETTLALLRSLARSRS